MLISVEWTLISDQLVRLKEIPVNEIQEPPIIFSRGDKKLVVKDNPKSVKNQLEILTNGKN